MESNVIPDDSDLNLHAVKHPRPVRSGEKWRRTYELEMERTDFTEAKLREAENLVGAPKVNFAVKLSLNGKILSVTTETPYEFSGDFFYLFPRMWYLIEKKLGAIRTLQGSSREQVKAIIWFPSALESNWR